MTSPTPVAVASSPSAPPKEYKESRIQLRLPDGLTLVETFDKNETLAAVRLFVQLKGSDLSLDSIQLMTTFPRKVFTEEDYETSLESLNLVPSATVIVTRKAPGM